MFTSLPVLSHLPFSKWIIVWNNDPKFTSYNSNKRIVAYIVENISDKYIFN